MSKNWTFVGSNSLCGLDETKGQKIRRERNFINAVRNLTIRSEAKMRADADENYLVDQKNKNQLKQAYADKKLKSKNCIAEAKALAK